MTECFCAGAYHKTGRYPNAKWEIGKVVFENDQPDFMPKLPDNVPCTNKAMDDWEDKNLPPEKHHQPRMLHCGCKRCNPVSM